jgi:hypothetical protein
MSRPAGLAGGERLRQARSAASMVSMYSSSWAITSMEA